MIDETEMPRKIIQAEIHSEIESNDESKELVRLAEKYGVDNVWDTTTLSRTFEVLGFMAPFCVVRRLSDGVKGSVQFQHEPRFYFNFQEA
jgi:hypothetical protein